ncbi:hypothetical protein E6H33_11410 [Candidatus Bathyarchaeota archaeon]|nr:MAG: hypothetical protein E6H33_11410 [Candidatus Bathyarchaeota archaeon]
MGDLPRQPRRCSTGRHSTSGPYVALGYAFVSMLPLTVLIEGRRTLEAGKMSLPAPVSGAASVLSTKLF